MRKTTNKETAFAPLFGGGQPVAAAKFIEAHKSCGGRIQLFMFDARGRKLVVTLTKAQALALGDELKREAERGTVSWPAIPDDLMERALAAINRSGSADDPEEVSA